MILFCVSFFFITSCSDNKFEARKRHKQWTKENAAKARNQKNKRRTQQLEKREKRFKSRY